MYDAFQQQTLIGWNQALKGRLALFWGHCLQHYMQQCHSHHSFNPSTWACKLIRLLRDYAYSQWKARNKFMHGVTSNESSSIRRAALLALVTLAYQNSASTPVSKHDHLFGLPLDQRLKQPTLFFQWLQMYTAGQKRFRLLHAMDKRIQPSIRRFLIARSEGRRPSIRPPKRPNTTPNCQTFQGANTPKWDLMNSVATDFFYSVL